MWSRPDVCSPIANSVVPFADIVVRPTGIVAINSVEKSSMFAVRGPDDCGSLHLAVDDQPSREEKTERASRERERRKKHE